jgi:hypothetical protein
MDPGQCPALYSAKLSRVRIHVQRPPTATAWYVSTTMTGRGSPGDRTATRIVTALLPTVWLARDQDGLVLDVDDRYLQQSPGESGLILALDVFRPWRDALVKRMQAAPGEPILTGRLLADQRGHEQTGILRRGCGRLGL